MTTPPKKPLPLEPDSTRDGTRDAVEPALRSDVSHLGGLLGQVLRESGGDDLLRDVERLRELVIDAYESARDASIDDAERLVATFTPERAEQVARAFTCYFHLANLAEEHHRVRVLREREAASGFVPDSIPDAVGKLTEELGREEAMRRLGEMRFHPVLTAHPTEARRRAVATGIRRIGDLLTERDGAMPGTLTGQDVDRRLLEEIDGLWRTSPLRTTRPTPLDEVRTAMGVFDQTLFEVVPRVYRLLDDWLLGEEAGVRDAVAPAFFRLGNWIAADRDGNPYVTAAVTEEAAGIASEHILLGLERVALRVGRSLTLGDADTPPSPELRELAATQDALAPHLTARIGTRAPAELHRRVLFVIAGRLAATRERHDDPIAYPSAAELLADLRVLQASLRSAGAHRIAGGELQGLVWQAETFGFHLAEMEVRQHSQVHREALREVLAVASADASGDRAPELAPMTVEVLDVFRTLARLQERHGVAPFSRFIVSFTQSADDIRTVHELAALALGSAEEAPVLDVIPLFETFADLNASTEILDGMIRLPQVAARLAQTGRKLEVMLGYSDSSKDVGPVSATFALFDAQARIAAWARENDIELTLFHGRGGALGRGGGPADRAVRAQPPGSVDGRFKLTEQGEVIFAHYGDKRIAARHIEQMAAATLLASAPSNEERNAVAAQGSAEMVRTMDEASRTRFFELVKAPGFAPWFAQVTPMEEIGLLALGSRPARRGLSVESLEDLRAIPWVFAWTQARINLTGWFGLGSALAAVGDEAVLRKAYDEWPLFTSMIDNVEMSLAKTDGRLAERYLALGDRPDLAALVTEEMELTREWVRKATGHGEILEGRPVLRRAVRLRSPYVDALSLLQLRALRALRTSARESLASGAPGQADATDPDHRLLLLTVNGIAAGLQNTG
ncbi:phosphoenolpyruvate carboxylase [Clavibacter michiganensis]|uniref:Phosphoenolpyruvate carboxylase n=2 Tax=Clavibacter michiganensis subsp. insidiosus TaxID=33014 RepID=A0A0D5CEE0_9MICO|nr:phosphoenolpyruvate carboxylase [Clavibacter michiganensis]AJW78018.1 phosphoenolpyruvate carboxylase [Clavibacter michiganensis subsp. insidiosus]AWF99608.1 phosphoenolpyruvate carboxylase [Clavibacter michiganensis subsp. insidiosus]